MSEHGDQLWERLRSPVTDDSDLEDFSMALFDLTHNDPSERTAEDYASVLDLVARHLSCPELSPDSRRLVAEAVQGLFRAATSSSRSLGMLTDPRLKLGFLQAVRSGLEAECVPALLVAIGTLGAGDFYFDSPEAMQRLRDLVVDRNGDEDAQAEAVAALGWFATSPPVLLSLTADARLAVRNAAVVALTTSPVAEVNEEREAITRLVDGVAKSIANPMAFFASGVIAAQQLAARLALDVEPASARVLDAVGKLEFLRPFLDGFWSVIELANKSGIPSQYATFHADATAAAEGMCAMLADCKRIVGDQGPMTHLVSNLEFMADQLNAQMVRFAANEPPIVEDFDLDNVRHLFDRARTFLASRPAS